MGLDIMHPWISAVRREVGRAGQGEDPVQKAGPGEPHSQNGPSELAHTGGEPTPAVVSYWMWTARKGKVALWGWPVPGVDS